MGSLLIGEAMITIKAVALTAYFILIETFTFLLALLNKGIKFIFLYNYDVEDETTRVELALLSTLILIVTTIVIAMYRKIDNVTMIVFIVSITFSFIPMILTLLFQWASVEIKEGIIVIKNKYKENKNLLEKLEG